MKTSAAQDAFLDVALERRSIYRNQVDVGGEGILAPFPDVTGHVENSKLIGLL